MDFDYIAIKEVLLELADLYSECCAEYGEGLVEGDDDLTRIAWDKKRIYSALIASLKEAS